MYDCKYHLVWITKYRKKILTAIVAERVRDLLRGICKQYEVEISKGHISKDHIHLLVWVAPQIAISKVVQYLKGKSSYKMLQENKVLQEQFWGRPMWARGYFVATSGNVTDEVIIEYINNQDIEDKEEDFRISE